MSAPGSRRPSTCSTPTVMASTTSRCSQARRSSGSSSRPWATAQAATRSGCWQPPSRRRPTPCAARTPWPRSTGWGATQCKRATRPTRWCWGPRWMPSGCSTSTSRPTCRTCMTWTRWSASSWSWITSTRLRRARSRRRPTSPRPAARCTSPRAPAAPVWSSGRPMARCSAPHWSATSRRTIATCTAARSSATPARKS